MKAKQLSLPSTKITVSILLALALLLSMVAALTLLDDDRTTNGTVITLAEEIPPKVAEQPSDATPDAINNNAQTQNDLLLYLIEEEKLAHDVYTVMYETYSSKVFSNILSSEETHQNRVLTLLTARGIADPRSTEIGVFTDPELQRLYDTLIAQGKQSQIDAFKVGKAIEEKDIQDITTQLQTATDQDIIDALTSLRNGSENHLRAFNRQIDKF